jgi:hypothetical protein
MQEATNNRLLKNHTVAEDESKLRCGVPELADYWGGMGGIIGVKMFVSILFIPLQHSSIYSYKPGVSRTFIDA